MPFRTVKQLVLWTCYNSDTANMKYLVNTHLKQYHFRQEIFFLIELYARLEEILIQFRKLQIVQRILLKTFNKLSIPYVLYFLILLFFNYRECVIFFHLRQGPKLTITISRTLRSAPFYEAATCWRFLQFYEFVVGVLSPLPGFISPSGPARGSISMDCH